MIVDILFSGSKGNCTLIRHGTTAILVDAGKSARAVSKALSQLGVSPCDIDAVFVTHEHSDHTSALEVLCSCNCIPVHMTSKSAVKIKPGSRLCSYLETHETDYTVQMGTLTVESFPLPHDSLCHVGYVVTDTEGDTFGIATDMGHVTERATEALSRCRRVMIEANHDVDMLMEGRYPADLKRRVLSKRGHLSNPDCAALAVTLAERGCRCVALAHLSPENNTPDIAFCEVRRELDMSGFEDVGVVVTDREETVRMPSFEEIKC